MESEADGGGWQRWVRTSTILPRFPISVAVIMQKKKHAFLRTRTCFGATCDVRPCSYALAQAQPASIAMRVVATFLSLCLVMLPQRSLTRCASMRFFMQAQSKFQPCAFPPSVCLDARDRALEKVPGRIGFASRPWAHGSIANLGSNAATYVRNQRGYYRIQSDESLQYLLT